MEPVGMKSGEVVGMVFDYAVPPTSGASRRWREAWGCDDHCLPILEVASEEQLGDDPHAREQRLQPLREQRQEPEHRWQCHRLHRNQGDAGMDLGSRCEGNPHGSRR